MICLGVVAKSDGSSWVWTNLREHLAAFALLSSMTVKMPCNRCNGSMVLDLTTELFDAIGMQDSLKADSMDVERVVARYETNTARILIPTEEDTAKLWAPS